MKPFYNKLIWSLFALVFLFGFYINTTSLSLQSTNAAQPIPATFSINSNGAATWSMDISVPPGIQNVQPSLSLTYTSGLSNSLLGIGFDLSGLSTISRTEATLAQDGFNGSISYGTQDRFALNGSRLMLEGSDNYGAEGTIYHTEKESYTKFKALGSAGLGPQNFQVWLKSGDYIEYGSTADSRILAVGLSGNKQGSVREWLLNKYQDINGNALTVNYTETPPDAHGMPISTCAGLGQHYPLRIDYTSNVGMSAKRSVQFIYEPRPDTIPTFLGGSKFTTAARLTQIQTWVKNSATDSSLVRTVNIDYQQNTPLNASRIEQIEVCGGNDCYTPSVFSWTNPADTLNNKPIAGPTALDNSGCVGDFNGDGKTDIISEEKNLIYLGSETGFENGTPSGISFNQGNYYVADFNGDGLSDMYIDSGTGRGGRVYYMEGGSFQQASNPVSLYMSSTCDNCIWQGDFNGDGMSDLATSDGRTCYFSFGTTDKTVGLSAPVPQYNMYVNASASKTYAADFNGDGLSDLFCFKSDMGYLSLSNFSDSTGFKEVIEISDMNFNATNPNNYTWFGDYNCDGLADILSFGTDEKYRLYNANGLGFESGVPLENLNLSAPVVWPGDYNNDCLLDFFINIPSGGKLYHSNGIDFENQSALDFDFEERNTWLGDFNGDGLPDLFNSDQGTVAYGGNSNEPDQNYNQMGNYINQIHNGVGTTIDIQYRPISDNQIYTAEPNNGGNDGIEGIRLLHQFNAIPLAPVQNPNVGMISIQNAQYVVNRWSENDGRGNDYLLDYTYEGAKYDYSGYGFLGFSAITTIDSQMNSIAKEYYLQAFPYTGLKDSTSIASLNGEMLSATSMDWEANFTLTETQGKVWKVQQVKNNKYDYANGIISNQQQLQYWYDGFSNNRLLKLTGDITNPANSIWYRSDFDNDTDTWQLGYLTTLIQSEDSSGLSPLTSKIYAYDANRNVSRIQTWFSDDNSWLNQAYGYDNFGNLLFATGFDGDTTFTNYDALYQTFPTENISPKNAQGIRLTAIDQYEPAYGNKVQSTDPNGKIFVEQYDGLGRVLAYKIPGINNDLFTAIQADYVSEDFGYSQRYILSRSWDNTNRDTIKNFYDALGRKYKTQYRGWNNQLIVTAYEYNAENQIVKHSLPYYDDDPINWVRKEFDPIGRVLRLRAPFGTNDSLVTTYEYQAGKVLVNEAVNTPDAKTASFTYNYFNNQYKITSYTNAENQTSTFSWDVLGRILEATDPQGIATAAAWNSLNENEWYYSPSFDTLHFEYSPTTNITRSINALDQTLTYTRDNFGRTIELADDEGVLISLTYDLANHQNGLGALCTVSQNDGNTQYAFQYDPLGNILQNDILMDGQQWQEKATFNPDLSLNSLLLPDSSLIENTYEQLSIPSLIQVTDSTGLSIPIFRLMSSNALNQLKDFTYGNGVIVQNDYDLSGFPNSLQVHSATQEPLIARSYEWGHNVRIKNITDELNNLLSADYDYDLTGRLIKSTNSTSIDSLAYDNSGNLTWNTPLLFKYENYQVQVGLNGTDTVYQAAYNACGNVTQRQVKTDDNLITYKYTYDSQLRLDSVFRNDTLTYTFTYDFRGKRNRKHNHLTGVPTYYVSDNFTVTNTPNGSHTAVNIGIGGQVIASYIDSLINVDYYHWDQNGSTLMTTDLLGNAQSSVAYTSFGNTDNANNPNLPYAFNGREYDPNSGLYYFSFRYYDPITGRFAAPDDQMGGSLTTADALNNYAFSLNSPISYADPTGHFPTLNSTTATKLEKDAAEGLILFAEGSADAASDGALTPALLDADETAITVQEGRKISATGKKAAAKNEARKRSRTEYDGKSNYWDSGTKDKKRKSNPPQRWGLNPGDNWTEEDYKKFFDEQIEDQEFNDPEDEDFNPKKPVKRVPRPGFRKGVVETVWGKSIKNGKVICPNSGEALFWNKKLHRTDQWHMGHRTGYEYKWLVKAMKKGEIRWQAVIDIYNNPDYYQAEHPKANRGHNFEGEKSLYDFTKKGLIFINWHLPSFPISPYSKPPIYRYIIVRNRRKEWCVND